MIYTLTYLPSILSGHAAYADKWRIYILEAYKGDEGLFQHELLHVRQYWWSFGLFPFLYRFKRYRLWAEVKAYKKQLQFPPATGDIDRYRAIYAKFITTKYKIDITEAEVLKLLN